MTDQLPILVVIIPLFGAFIAGLVGLRKGAAARITALVALTLNFGAAVALVMENAGGHVIRYRIGGWPAPQGITFRVDGLSAPIILIIATVALISCWYASAPARRLGGKEAAFYTLKLLLITGLTGMTITADAFNLYVFLEIAALTSYALLAIGNRRSLVATSQYLLQGAVGASFYLLGVGYLYLMTGTLNMDGLARILPDLHGSPAIQAAFAMILIGTWLKMGFFPLHSWLPGVYSAAAPQVAPLIAPLATKVAVYAMIRMMLSVFGPVYVFEHLSWQPIVVWLAAVAVVAGSFWALMQRDLRRLITWIMVAEIGYMVGGAWLGTRSGMTGAVFHLLNDAMMTLAIFCFAGALTYHHKIRSIDDLGGAFTRMPWAMAAFVVVACSMIGIPPTCGFFSKFYLLLGSIEAGAWHFTAALIIASLCNAVIFYRIFEKAFFAGGHGDALHHDSTVLPPRGVEGTRSMVIPLVISSALLLFMGFGSSRIVGLFLNYLPWGAGG